MMGAGEGYDEGRGMDMMCVFGTMMYVEISWYDPFVTVNNHTELGFAGIQVARAWVWGYEVGREIWLGRGSAPRSNEYFNEQTSERTARAWWGSEWE